MCLLLNRETERDRQVKLNQIRKGGKKFIKYKDSRNYSLSSQLCITSALFQCLFFLSSFENTEVILIISPSAVFLLLASDECPSTPDYHKISPIGVLKVIASYRQFYEAA